MVELYYEDQLQATFVLHHYIQQPSLDHEASQASSKWEIFLLCMLADSPAKVDPKVHKPISTEGKLEAEHLGQGHTVKSLLRAD